MSRIGSDQRRRVMVETDWLADHLDDPAIRIIEVDEDTAAYGRGHIPNAVAWDWLADLHDPVSGDYVDQETLAGLLRRSGVDHATTVVLYGGADNGFAAYAYWLLRYRGFDQVRLLSGGRRAWELEGRPLTGDVPAPATTLLRIDGPERWHLRAYRDDGLTRLETVNVPWAATVNDDGRFKAVEELRHLYEGLGVTPDQVVVTERSAHTWFVLHELLAYPSVAICDGHHPAVTRLGSWGSGGVVDLPADVRKVSESSVRN